MEIENRGREDVENELTRKVKRFAMLIETIEATSGLYSRVVKVERIEISCRNIYIER